MAPVDPASYALLMIYMGLVALQLDYLFFILKRIQADRAVSAFLEKQLPVRDFPEILHDRAGPVERRHFLIIASGRSSNDRTPPIIIHDAGENAQSDQD